MTIVEPQVDNERAADYLRLEIGQNDGAVQWVAVRPDNLADEAEVTEYELHSSQTRSTIFDTGVMSRINVSQFMATLITEDDTWNVWEGRMPVIYNKEKGTE